MKKWFIVLLSLLLLIPAATAMADSQDDLNKLTQEVEKSLVKGDFYYHKNSVEITDSIQLNGNVLKVITPDDPETKEDETEVEKYKSDLIVAHVQFKEKRDNMFYFTKNELYFYDVKNEEFLLYSNVFDNPEIEQFFKKYSNDLGKHLDTSSQILFLAILFSIFVVAFLIFVFHNENRTNQKIYYNGKYTSTYYS